MDQNHTKQEPGMVQHVQSDPSVLGKEENLENTKQDDVEHQCVQGASTLAGTGSVNEACSTSLIDLLNVKHEPREMDVAPTVLRHMDTHYTVSKNISAVIEKNLVADNCNKPMPNNRVKEESVTDKLRDPEDNNDYRCDKCLKTFQSRISFKNHCRYMHGTERYGCKECNKEYKWKAYLRSHIKNVHGNEQYECDICNKIYTSKLGLSRHILTLHSHKFPEPEDGNYRCDKCMKTYQSKIVFMNHSRYMHGTERSKCTKCDKEYKWLPYIRNNIKSVHSNRQYECDICTKIYFSRHGISRHVLLHGDRFPDSQPNLLPSVRISVQRTYSRSTLPKNPLVTSAVASTSDEQNGAVAVKPEPADAKLELGPVADLQPCLPSLHKVVQRTYSRSSFPKNGVFSTSKQAYGAIDMKSEPADAELELGPVVFQHMDSNYPLLKKEPQND